MKVCRGGTVSTQKRQTLLGFSRQTSPHRIHNHPFDLNEKRNGSVWWWVSSSSLPASDCSSVVQLPPAFHLPSQWPSGEKRCQWSTATGTMLLPPVFPSGKHLLLWRRMKDNVSVLDQKTQLSFYSPKTTKWYANKGYYYWWVFSDENNY